MLILRDVQISGKRLQIRHIKQTKQIKQIKQIGQIAQLKIERYLSKSIPTRASDSKI